MAEKYIKAGRILVPESVAPVNVNAENEIQLSFWQMMINQMFYQRDDSPLELISTLGSHDPLLPRAAARDFLERQAAGNVHEIGPGNFHFARTFMDAVGDVSYYGHDFSDSSYVFAERDLEPYKGRIHFSKTSIDGFPEKVGDDPLNLIMVEVLDDTLTEFFTLHEETEYMLCVKPEMKREVEIPSKAMAGKMLALNGDFSLATQRMASKGLDRKYSAQEIIELIDLSNWGRLGNVHPAFLKHLEYNFKDFIPAAVDKVYDWQWKRMPKAFREFGDAVIKQFREELAEAEGIQKSRNDPEPYVLTLPLAGLKLLWDLKDRKAHIDFFDYGSDSLDYWVEPFRTYNGQITATVNFRIMDYAAQWLGFDTRLEKNRDFIKRVLGEDTIMLGYVRRALKGLSQDEMKEMLYRKFHSRVKELSPDAECTLDNIFSFRVKREEYDAFIAEGKEKGIIKHDFQVTEGSYHLAVHK